MMLKLFLRTLLAALRSRHSLLLANVALRHQIEVLQRNSTRPELRWRDRAFWDILSCIWSSWRRSLYIVQPETVIRWHRQGFRYYCRWKSRPRRSGRPRVTPEIRDLIREMSQCNPTWGAPRVHGELRKLGIDIHQSTVSTYMVRPPRPPSQTWRTFLVNHAKDIAAIDFFIVPTATFRIIYVFLVLDNARRRIVHFNVTESPTAAWTGQQIVEALRECLDHVIIVNERHLRRVLNEYFDYYHRDRTHLGLEKDCPESREVEPPDSGAVGCRPILGGLHHRYYCDAA